jgi:hypothetical protein
MHAAFSAAAIENDGRLGTHTLRKTWARNVYKNSGNDIMILKTALFFGCPLSYQQWLSSAESGHGGLEVLQTSVAGSLAAISSKKYSGVRHTDTVSYPRTANVRPDICRLLFSGVLKNLVQRPVEDGHANWFGQMGNKSCTTTANQIVLHTIAGKSDAFQIVPFL